MINIGQIKDICIKFGGDCDSKCPFSLNKECLFGAYSPLDWDVVTINKIDTSHLLMEQKKG
jgi:hypothetical protein